MKRLLKAPIAELLALISRGIIAKYKPYIVMVTGSVGKTSTKDAIAAALTDLTFVRASEKSYNSEFGVPLTIIGAKNPWISVSGWLRVFGEGLALLFLSSHYPKVLVLEVGADRPGDLARILKIATPDAVVVTRLPDVPVHVEAYATPSAVRDEEFAPAYALAPGAPLIISSRDQHAIAMAKNTEARVIRFGFSKEADIHIHEPTIDLDEKGRPTGMMAREEFQGKEHLSYVPGVLGRPQVLAPAAALAVGIALGKAPQDVIASLKKHYVPPAGRARLLSGSHGSLLIDDTYNASPAAVEEALDTLTLLPSAYRRIAVLGDMLELGRYSREEHERIGTLAAKNAQMLVTVGTRSRAMQEAAVAAGMKEDAALAFDTALEAVEALKHEVREGDAILIKGSQSMRMERIVEALLANPEDTKYLVRQDKEWKRKK